MTGFTHRSGCNMRCPFTLRHRTIVTTGAGTHHLPMIHSVSRHRRPNREGCGHMTGIADVGATDMCYRFCVTGRTDAKHLRMIHGTCCYRCPRCRSCLMTGITHVCGIDMCCAFSGCRHAIVATGACADCLSVVHGTTRNRCPTYGQYRMTKFAIIAAINVRR